MQTIQLKQTEQDYRSREAYKTLRTNVEFSGDNVQVVAVTSCTPNEERVAYPMSWRLPLPRTGRRC